MSIIVLDGNSAKPRPLGMRNQCAASDHKSELAHGKRIVGPGDRDGRRGHLFSEFGMAARSGTAREQEHHMQAPNALATTLIVNGVEHQLALASWTTLLGQKRKVAGTPTASIATSTPRPGSVL